LEEINTQHGTVKPPGTSFDQKMRLEIGQNQLAGNSATTVRLWNIIRSVIAVHIIIFATLFRTESVLWTRSPFSFPEKNHKFRLYGNLFFR